ncbi:MAG: glycosyltransferase [Pseudomonadales bacterium]
MKKLLFMTPELPFPAHSGGKLKSLKLIEHLQRHFDVTLCCPLKGDDAAHLGEFQDAYPMLEVVSERVVVARSAGNLLRSYVQKQPLNVLRTASKQLQTKVSAIIDEFPVVFLDHYEVGQFLPDSYTGTVIYHGHNAYHRIWQTYSHSTRNPFYKLATHFEANRVKQFEVAVANRSDLVFAAPDDLTALSTAGVNQPEMAETYHLGEYGNGETGPSWYQLEANLVYVGFLGWEANVQGLLWFIHNVWPRLQQKHPELKFRIVGKNADERLRKAAARHPNIELLGFVKDLDDVFSHSLVCVAPLTFGSGMKVKILSALARGIPVATTPIGAESIAAEHREHMMIAKTADEMALDIDELLMNQTLWQRLANNSRQLIKDKYTWERLFADMDAVMSRLIDSDEQQPHLAKIA